MAKLIIDAVTGTILNAEGCYIIDDTDITSDDFTDREIAELAERVGKSIKKIGTDTGWGDNAYRYTVSYSPLSIRDEANSLIEGGIYGEDEEEHSLLMWAGEDATEEELTEVSNYIMSWESIWQDFGSTVMEALREIKKQKEGK